MHPGLTEHNPTTNSVRTWLLSYFILAVEDKTLRGRIKGEDEKKCVKSLSKLSKKSLIYLNNFLKLIYV